MSWLRRRVFIVSARSLSRSMSLLNSVRLIVIRRALEIVLTFRTRRRGNCRVMTRNSNLSLHRTSGKTPAKAQSLFSLNAPQAWQRKTTFTKLISAMPVISGASQFPQQMSGADLSVPVTAPSWRKMTLVCESGSGITLRKTRGFAIKSEGKF